MNDSGVKSAVRLSQYLSALLFYPFASLLIVLLSFNSLHRRSGVDIERLSQFSNQTLGTPLGRRSGDSASFVSSTPSEAEVKEKISENEEKTKSDSSDESNDSPEDKLTKLSELKEKGLIDEEDYNSKKEEILKTI